MKVAMYDESFSRLWVTSAMIAVPLYFGETIRGVVSCVQHEGEEGAGEAEGGGFTAEHLGEVEMLADLLGRLIDYRLAAHLLGIERP